MVLTLPLTGEEQACDHTMLTLQHPRDYLTVSKGQWVLRLGWPRFPSHDLHPVHTSLCAEYLLYSLCNWRSKLSHGGEPFQVLFPLQSPARRSTDCPSLVRGRRSAPLKQELHQLMRSGSRSFRSVRRAAWAGRGRENSGESCPGRASGSAR